MAFKKITITLCCVLCFLSCNRGTHHKGKVTGTTIYTPEGIFSYTEGNVSYHRETSLYFIPDTSLIVKNMKNVCKDIDVVAKSSPVDINVEIWDVSEEEINDYLNITVYPPELSESNIVLGVDASRDYLENDTLVPIVEKCIQFITKEHIPVINRIVILDETNNIDLLTEY